MCQSRAVGKGHITQRPVPSSTLARSRPRPQLLFLTKIHRKFSKLEAEETETACWKRRSLCRRRPRVPLWERPVPSPRLSTSSSCRFFLATNLRLYTFLDNDDRLFAGDVKSSRISHRPRSPRLHTPSLRVHCARARVNLRPTSVEETATSSTGPIHLAVLRPVHTTYNTDRHLSIILKCKYPTA